MYLAQDSMIKLKKEKKMFVISYGIFFVLTFKLFVTFVKFMEEFYRKKKTWNKGQESQEDVLQCFSPEANWVSWPAQLFLSHQNRKNSGVNN